MMLVAAKLRAQPSIVIAHTLETVARWRVQGQSAPHRLDQWEKLLRDASAGGDDNLDALLHVMESDDPVSARLRDFHPFHGLLTREERRTVRPAGGYKH